MKRETAILMVSFGTAHLDTLDRSITATEKAVEECFPGYPVYRAFLNAAVIRSLKERHTLQIDNVAEALARIEGDGFKKQPYSRLCFCGELNTGCLPGRHRKRESMRP